MSTAAGKGDVLVSGGGVGRDWVGGDVARIGDWWGRGGRRGKGWRGWDWEGKRGEQAREMKKGEGKMRNGRKRHRKER